MNEIINPVIQFEKEISISKMKSTKQLLVGLGLIIFLGISFIQIINLFPSQNNNGNQGTNAVISQTVSAIPTIQLIMILILIITILIFYQTIQIKRSIETNKAIKRLFQLYGIKTIAKNKGQLEISENLIFTVEWNTKGYFVIKKLNNILSFATSSEIYWKLIYYSNKYKNFS